MHKIITKKILPLILFLLSISLFAQKNISPKEVEKCKKHQAKEKAFILKNKITQIEIHSFFSAYDSKTNKKYWQLSGKSIYEYDLNAKLISSKLFTYNLITGEEKLLWQGRYVYNSEGICDSVSADKWKEGFMLKTTSPYQMFVSCYYGKKKLKKGLIIKAKNSKGHGSPKQVFYFK